MQALQRTSEGATKDECRRYILKNELQALYRPSGGDKEDECRCYEGRVQALQRTSAGTTKDECRRYREGESATKNKLQCKNNKVQG